eukprot:CAMPEP_0119412200 /NCGR_PEP_ID=MMETSP1335-20130426/4719_1 /TAXON_ID=259385 /ORGANISM="Chrysoculter rhomboideus, Strain RCC1486" /LENGTH=70 /DNA_ID=CAMNT_0007436919 /DNA_START=95 /DNA_END=304 /DNA_ORIENTATION=+
MTHESGPNNREDSHSGLHPALSGGYAGIHLRARDAGPSRRRRRHKSSVTLPVVPVQFAIGLTLSQSDRYE